MKLVLDSGALLAVERRDRAMWRRLKDALAAGHELVTHAGVIGQVWRGGAAGQAQLVRALGAIEVRSFDEALGRAAGDLLARTKQRDVVAAGVVLLAEDGDQILTADPEVVQSLALASGRELAIIPV